MPRGASVAAVLFTGNDGAGASLTGYNGLLIPRLILVAVGCGHGRRYTLCDDPRPGFDAFAYSGTCFRVVVSGRSHCRTATISPCKKYNIHIPTKQIQNLMRRHGKSKQSEVQSDSTSNSIFCHTRRASPPLERAACQARGLSLSSSCTPLPPRRRTRALDTARGACPRNRTWGRGVGL